MPMTFRAGGLHLDGLGLIASNVKVDPDRPASATSRSSHGCHQGPRLPSTAADRVAARIVSPRSVKNVMASSRSRTAMATFAILMGMGAC